MRSAVIVLAFIALTLLAAAASATDFHLIRVTPETPAELEALSAYASYGVSEIPPHRLGRSYDFEIPARKFEAFAGLGLRYEILPPSRNAWEDVDYNSYQEVYDFLVATVAAHPDIAVIENLGVSTRDGVIVWGLKLSDNPALQEDEPDVVFNSVIHAREPVNANITVAFIEQMIAGYGSDADITALIDDTEIWVIPILNPEGYLYVETGITSPWWRKNKRDNDGDGEFEGVVYESCGSEYPSYPDGVDLNRNYGSGWPSAGSGQECSIVYRGPAAFSENESQLEKALFERERPVAAISFHSYSQYVGYCGQDPAGIQLCEDIAGAIHREGSGYYDADFFYGNGQSYNWMYWDLGTQAYLIETATEFFPHGAARIAGIVAENLNGMWVLLDRVHGNGIRGHVTDASSGQPLAAEVIVAGEPQIDLPRMSEPVHGRFARLLEPGTYTVTARLDGYHDAIQTGVVVGGGVPTTLDFALIDATTAVDPAPARLALGQNHPNPFNPKTTIRYRLPESAAGELAIYAIDGRRLRSFPAQGAGEIVWDGRDEAGRELPSGLYLYRLRAEGISLTRKLLLAR